MKKRRISFSWLLTTAMVPTLLVCSCANTTTQQSVDNIEDLDNNAENSVYITINFLPFEKEEGITFEGSTTIKTRSGKTFAQINPPIAKKANAEFDHWFYLDMDTKEQVTVQPNTLLTDDLVIYPLFNDVPPISNISVAFNVSTEDYDVLSGSLVSPLFQVGTIWDAVEKPTVRISEAHYDNEYFVAGWSLVDGGEIIPYDYVPTRPITVYPVTKPRKLDGKMPIDASLNFTATSDNATLTLKQHGEYPVIVQYYYDYNVNTIWNAETREPNTLIPDEPLVIPKGHTINIIGGDFRDGTPKPFAMSDQDYNSFQISGDIWLSGTLGGLLNQGVSEMGGTIYDPVSQIKGGDYALYGLFENATNNDPNSHLHISQDVRFRSAEYQPADTDPLRPVNQSFIPFGTYGTHMFERMFANSGLESIPHGLFKRTYSSEMIGMIGIPDYRLSEYCYKEMFLNCNKLWFMDEDFVPASQKGEIVPAHSLEAMFKGCSNLRYVTPYLFTSAATGWADIDGFADGALIEMFSGCSKMKITYRDYTAGPLFIDLYNSPIKTKNDAFQMFHDWILSDNFVDKDGTPEVDGNYFITFAN